MDTNTPLAIETRELQKTFGDVAAVDGLDLEVEAGSFFGFLGPNGAGKSTTIRILTGMLLPSTGTASILGHDIVDDPVNAKKIMGVVSEEGAVFLGIMLYGAALMGYVQVNHFAWEKSGFSVYFSSPAQPREIIIGKNIATWSPSGSCWWSTGGPSLRLRWCSVIAEKRLRER